MRPSIINVCTRTSVSTRRLGSVLQLKLNLVGTFLFAAIACDTAVPLRVAARAVYSRQLTCEKLEMVLAETFGAMTQHA